MNRTKTFSISIFTFAFIASILLLVGCSKEQKAKRVYQKNPVAVKVERVKRGSIVYSLEYKGTVYPWAQANITPETSGRVMKIYKKQGDTVKKGELLAEMDTTTLKLQLKQAQAALAVSNASFKDAQLNYNRLEKLLEKKAISTQQMEKAQLALEAADTELKSAQANADVIQHTLNYSIMRAPFDGVITSKNAEEGDVINPMMGMGTSVLTLMDLKNVKVILEVPAEEIEKIKTGQNCTVTVVSLQDETFTGEIYTKNLAADPISKTFKVEVKIPNPETKIKSGIYATVRIETFRKDNCLILPVKALMTDNNASFVVLYVKGKSQYQNVKVGAKNESVFEILEGLTENQEVVVEGNYDLKDNALITSEGVK